eukprot:gene1336-1866_t
MLLFAVQYLLILSQTSIVSSQLNQGYPPCTNAIFTNTNKLDINAMLFNCSNNIPGPLLPPSYFPNGTNDFSPVAVKFGMIINNLINVDDITSQLTMDFYYRLGWSDPRWFIPDLFNYLNPEAQQE